jgi:hypothetical protein
MLMTKAIFDSLSEEFGDEIACEEIVGKSLSELFCYYINSSFMVTVMPAIVENLPLSDQELWEIVDYLFEKYGPKEDVSAPTLREIMESVEPRRLELRGQVATIFHSLCHDYVTARNIIAKVSHDETVADLFHTFLDYLIWWQTVDAKISEVVEMTVDSRYYFFGRQIFQEVDSQIDQIMTSGRSLSISISLQ